MIRARREVVAAGALPTNCVLAPSRAHFILPEWPLLCLRQFGIEVLFSSRFDLPVGVNVTHLQLENAHLPMSGHLRRRRRRDLHPRALVASKAPVHAPRDVA